MNWKAAFEICQPSSGATAAQLDEFAREVAAPLSFVELEEISHAHRKVMAALPSEEPLDMSQWHLPDNPLPSSYLDFLRWSNGGFF